MPSLFSERNTVFDHDIWDRYSYVQFLRRFQTTMAEEDFEQRNRYEYSLLQDGTYALMGLPVLPLPDNKTAFFWHKITGTNWFRRLQRLYRQDASGEYVATDTLNRIAKTYLLDDPQCSSDLSDELDELEQEMGQDPDPQEQDDDPPDSNDQGQDGDGEANEQSDPSDDGQSNEQDSGDEQDSSDPQPGPQNGKFDKIGSDFLDQMTEETKVQQAEDLHDATNALAPYMSGPVDHKTEQAVYVAMELDATKLAKFLGFAMRAVTGAHHLADATTGELTRYRNVSWSNRLHPVDMAGLAQGDLRTQSRMAEGSLRERQYEDRTPRGRGPVVLLRDESGSMGWYRGKKHDQARALEVALANAFNADHRDLISIAWSDGPTRTCVYGQDDAYAHLTTFQNGGTEIYTALVEGARVADEYLDGADILVITDGLIDDRESAGVKRMANELHEQNGRIWVVLVETSEYELPWADGVVKIGEIEDSKKLSDLVSLMNKKEINLRGKKVAV